MNCLSKVLVFGLLPLFSLFAQDGFHTSTITLSLGGGETPTYKFSASSPDRCLLALRLGAKFVVPLASDRFEVFLGGGGAYAFHSDGSYHNAILAQGNIGGRIALDRARRFWLGTSGHFFANLPATRGKNG